MSWFVYILECKDQTLYTGVTTDLDRRLKEHNGESGGANKGAKYTRVRRPVKMVFSESSENRSQACKREAQIKRLSKKQKLQLIESYHHDVKTT